ncbi:MAG: glutamate--tRNA ligase [Candidatus Riflebacteria bacterium]|nr:glutamate--tRNA ligase [Candidatus Riflebacteria bacterium]
MSSSHSTHSHAASSSTAAPSAVRVRFAPSPTGYLHVGGARTALFNWLFARGHHGTFILRIEDTDQERSTLEAEEGLLRDMRWLGLDWDEGPGIGGPHGPYRQSERLPIYRKAVETLLSNGSAYPCFCSEEDLERKRQEAEAEHRSPHYDGTCLHLSPDEVKKRLAAGEPHVVRVHVPGKDYAVDDLVRGRVEWKTETLGDFIIMRSNGMPVYNFCVVVDDADMEITHVVRAEEHLPNTHRQLILYEALGRPIPIFAHVSLILGPDKTKLSKRHGATSVGQYKDDGFLKDAMINYLALLGWAEGVDREIYTRAELAEKFSLERINPAPAVFDQTKLAWMNGQYLRSMPVDELIKLVAPKLKTAWPGDSRFDSDEFIRKLTSLVLNHLTTLNDVVKEAKAVLDDAPAPVDEDARAAIAVPEVPALFTALRGEFATCPWNKDGFNAAIKAAGKTAGVKGKTLFMPIRVKLTGTCHGAELVGILDLLGREEILRRLN